MNLDEQLDERLHGAAPPVSVRTAEMRRELDALVVAATPPPRPRRRTTRATVVAAATVGALGLGTAVAAAGLLPGWSLLTGSGQTCQVEVTADPRRPGDGEPGITFDAKEEEEAETLTAARVFLQRFDYDSIDREAANSRWAQLPADRRWRSSQGLRDHGRPVTTTGQVSDLDPFMLREEPR